MNTNHIKEIKKIAKDWKKYDVTYRVYSDPTRDFVYFYELEMKSDCDGCSKYVMATTDEESFATELNLLSSNKVANSAHRLPLTVVEIFKAITGAFVQVEEVHFRKVLGLFSRKNKYNLILDFSIIDDISGKNLE